MKDRITPPWESRLRLTLAHFDELDALAAAENWPEGWRMSHLEREANRGRVLSGRLDRDLWVFAYGSHIWDPAVYVDEIRPATLEGWRRRFCMLVHGGRGSIDKPGLMAGLDEGGSCQGVTFRIPAEIVDRESEIMWRREMFAGSYRPEFLTVSTPPGEVEALAFVIDRDHERYVSETDMTMAEAADIIAHAEGRNGTNFDYLDTLCTHLALLGLEDPHLVDLHRRAVACRRRQGGDISG